jgi:flagellar biosynthesis regulator FlaF
VGDEAVTFLLGEDKALREKLQGMVVHDQKADGSSTPRSVGVWFGQPDQELRSQSYPYITIDMMDVQRDTEREMRGIVDAAYLQPDNLNVPGANQFEVDMPIPVNIDYQITTYARHPRHDREILAQILGTRLLRFGYLEIVEKDVTSGNTETITSTFRRMDLLSVAKRDSTEQAKRLFVNAITVRVSSEIVQSAYRAIYQVTNVHVDMPSSGRELHYDGIGSFVISD